MRRDVLGPETLGVEQPGGVQVAPAALRGRDVLRDRLPHQWMDESQRLARQQHLHGGERVGGGTGLGDLEPGQRRRVPKRDVVPEDRDGRRQRAGGGAEPPDAHPQRPRDGVGRERPRQP